MRKLILTIIFWVIFTLMLVFYFPFFLGLFKVFGNLMFIVPLIWFILSGYLVYLTFKTMLIYGVLFIIVILSLSFFWISVFEYDNGPICEEGVYRGQFELSDPTFSDPFELTSQNICFYIESPTKFLFKFKNIADFDYSKDKEIVPSVICKDKLGKISVLNHQSVFTEIPAGDVDEYYYIFEKDQMIDYSVGDSYPCKIIVCQNENGTESVECIGNESDNVYSSKAFFMHVISE